MGEAILDRLPLHQYSRALEQSVIEPLKIPDEAHSIISILEHISSEFYCASWLGDIEHSVWEDLITPEEPPDPNDPEARLFYVFNMFPSQQLEELQRLAAACRGWVRYDSNAKCWEHSRVFVPIDEWIKIHAAHTGKEMTDEQRQRFEDFMGAPERKAQEIKAQREKLLDCAARVALAIQASGQIEVHKDFIEILKMIPEEIRRCPRCGIDAGNYHHPNCPYD